MTAVDRLRVPAVLATAALWGFGFGGIPTAMPTWGAHTEPARLEQVGGLIVTVAIVTDGIRRRLST